MRFFAPLWLALCTLTAVIFLSCSSKDIDTPGVDGYLRIGGGAEPVGRIVITDPLDPVMVFAAGEMQKYVEKISGARLPVIDGNSDAEGSPEIRLEIRSGMDVKFDGYRIEVNSDGIVLAAVEPRGLLYAVYDLLRETGCAFVYPGEAEEIVPRLDEIAIPFGSRSEQPVLEHRGLALYGLDATALEAGGKIIDWMAKNRMNIVLISEDRPSDCAGNAHGCVWCEVTEELLPELQKRGFVIDMSEHSTHVFFPRSLFTEHPDWFALNNGKRTPGQICYSNPEAVEYYARAQTEYAAKHPEIDFLGTWPLDGGGYCECEGCKSPETVFKSVVRVAEKVGEVRPDLAIEHLAYKVQTWQVPQSVAIPENVSVLFCQRHLVDIGKSWVEATRNANAQGTYLFEYKMGDNYHFAANIWLRPEFAGNVVSHAVEVGYRGVISLYLPIQNWWRSSFNEYFFAAACWNGQFNVKQELREYYRQYYGDYEEQVGEVFRIIVEDMQNEYLHAGHNSLKGRNDNKIAPVGIEFTQRGAEKASSILDGIRRQNPNPEIARRLDRLQLYIDYFKLYYESYLQRSPADLKKLIEFSRTHTEGHDGVIMYPEYLKWRLSEYYR